MIKKIIVILSYLFKNNIEKSLEENITKIECKYCELAFKPVNKMEVCNINNISFSIKIRDEL
jgi:hypothetical protein